VPVTGTDLEFPGRLQFGVRLCRAIRNYSDFGSTERQVRRSVAADRSIIDPGAAYIEAFHAP